MNDRESSNPGQQQRQNTGAGSRQQEQATAGGSMQNEDTEGSGQQEQQGGTYRPEGDRGVDYQADQSGELGMGERPAQQPGTESQQDGFDRSRQQEQSDSERQRQGSQQDGKWDDEENR